VTDDRSASRRSVLAALGATAAAALAGCTTGGAGGDPTDTTAEATDATTTADGSTTTERTTEQTTTQTAEQSFAELYAATVDEPWTQDGEEFTTALRPNQIDKYENKDKFDSFDNMMVELKDDILNNWTVINDSQELTKHLQHALHNDLNYKPSEVRVLGRDMAGGGTYTAVLHRNQNGDWIKDLTLPFDGTGAYLAHNDTKNDIDFNDEASRGLWNIWNLESTPTPATFYSSLAENNWEEADQDSIDRVMNWTSKGNDHIVVGEPYDDPTVGYTVEAAQAVEEIQNWHENETFNEEMEMVEQATEAYHNSEEPYLKMEMQNGELTAVPTEEYTGPEELYLN